MLQTPSTGLPFWATLHIRSRQSLLWLLTAFWKVPLKHSVLASKKIAEMMLDTAPMCNTALATKALYYHYWEASSIGHEVPGMALSHPHPPRSCWLGRE